MNKTQNEINKYSLDEYQKEKAERAYKYFKHADDHYAQRINFFLVAESMLVISFVTSLTQSSITADIGMAIGIIGLIFTSIWLYTNARLEVRTKYMIEEHLMKDDLLYKHYIQSAGGQYSKVFLTYTLPISMNLLWIFFICYQLQIKNPLFGFILFISFILMVVIGEIMDKTLQRYKSSNDNSDK